VGVRSRRRPAPWLRWRAFRVLLDRVRLIDEARRARRDELGEIGPDTLLPITTRPELIGLVVAGGPGTHSVYVPGYGVARSVTRAIVQPLPAG
jgi:hypothetical protein